MPMAADKCSVCNNLSADTSYSDAIPFDLILSRARQGCASCSLLRDVTSGSLSYFPAVKPDIVTLTIPSHTEVKICVFPGGESGNPSDFYDISLLFEGQSENRRPTVSDSVQEIERRNTSSDVSTQKACEWISHCTTHHSRCGPGNPSQLPKRVLDVYQCSPDVVLIETKGEVARYICLSHCWGKTKLIVTRERDLEANKDRIPFGSLPRTFQDTVEFARKLKVRYLWIDSLCIIQDKIDWNIEANKMARIYQNAYLTVAATKSPNGEGGCFTRDLEVGITGMHTDGRPYRARCTRPVFHWYSYLGGVDSSHFPLLNRGWVYQERLLSPRMLHFGPQELLWECMEENSCECGRFAMTERLHSKLNYSRTQHTDPHTRPDRGTFDVGNIWRRKVHEYSHLSLTFPSDKLPAISGLAQQEQLRRPQVSYLAGLWQDTLICDLIWFSTFTSKPAKKRAPSWSWAALDGRIFFFDTPSIESNSGGTFRHAWSRIVHAECRPAGENPTGEVSAGYVTIAGRVKRAIFLVDNGLRCLDTGAVKVAEAYVDPPANKFSTDCYFKDREATPPVGTVLYLLRLAQIQAEWASLDDETETKQFEVSIVLNLVDSAMQVFERVGILVREGTLFDERDGETTMTII